MKSSSGAETFAGIAGALLVILIVVRAVARADIPTWLIDHQVLTTANPVWVITAGAGLDWPRILIAAGVLFALMTACALAARRSSQVIKALTKLSKTN